MRWPPVVTSFRLRPFSDGAIVRRRVRATSQPPKGTDVDRPSWGYAGGAAPRRMLVSALHWIDVHGRNAPTNPGDDGKGWLAGGVRLPVNGPGRNVDEVARARIDVTVMALELETEHATHDVETRLVALVVVPTRYRSRLSLYLSGPEQRQLKGQGAVHARRWVRRSQVGWREHSYGPRQLSSHGFRVP